MEVLEIEPILHVNLINVSCKFIDNLHEIARCNT